MTKTQTIELLQQQLPGFYSVEQVINMINDIEDSSEPTGILTDDQIIELADQIASEIVNQGTDIVSDYDLSLNYKEIELDNIDLNESDIASLAKDAIKDFLNNQ